uniref:methyltransferase domain-containing protein n=1 Tax=Nitrospira cf. moscoviensis SBR1015 TaxID=96242 RepID=UPI00117EAFFD|nr:methyltransferase domain-containing protein [Nitrospira cf. moscoviensis SBR1015]
MFQLRHLVHPVRSVKALCLRLSSGRSPEPGRSANQPLESLPDVPDLFCMYRTLIAHPELTRRSGGWLYQNTFYPDYLTVGGAGHAIFPEAVKYCRGNGIDVGAGLWPLPGATPVDLWRGAGTNKCVADFEKDSLDYVFSSHCLEHIETWNESLQEWVDRVRLGGTIFLYLPHPDCAIWHPGSPFVGDGHKWIPTPQVIRQALEQMGCVLLRLNEGPDAMCSFFICARKETRNNPASGVTPTHDTSGV